MNVNSQANGMSVLQSVQNTARLPGSAIDNAEQDPAARLDQSQSALGFDDDHAGPGGEVAELPPDDNDLPRGGPEHVMVDVDEHDPDAGWVDAPND